MVEPIETVIDLFAAGAHWIAEGLISAGRGFAAFVSRLRERYGTQLTASQATMGQFWRLTRQANASAQLVRQGITPPITAVPVLPISTVTSRFLSQGVVTISDEQLGEPGRPFSSSLPWQQQSDVIPTIDQIRQRIDTSVQQEAEGTREYRNRARRNRDRAQYIRDRSRAPEYDIAPLFIWRTA